MSEERFEEKFSREEKSMAKRERKIATSKDRSKYKKTDEKMLQKAERPPQTEGLLRGRVLSIISQGMIVECEGLRYTCTLRGVLKKERGAQKNLVAVGDFVLFEKTEGEEGVISYVEPRKSILSRADNLLQRKEQLIAANIDQVLITVSVLHPPLKTFIVDRYIIATEKGNMKPVIIVNKIDLLTDPSFSEEVRAQELELYEDFVKAYQDAGIPVISVSTVTGAGIEELRKVMHDKASVFSGQSGVGKSSLINVVAGYDLRVGGIVEKTKKGSHTTTTAQLLQLEFGGWCIDTPGIRSFGLWDLKLDEVEQYFSEIYETGLQCKYPDCAHLHEKECAVLKAVEAEEISILRYASYQYLLQSLQQQHRTR